MLDAQLMGLRQPLDEAKHMCQVFVFEILLASSEVLAQVLHEEPGPTSVRVTDGALQSRGGPPTRVKPVDQLLLSCILRDDLCIGFVEEELFDDDGHAIAPVKFEP